MRSLVVAHRLSCPLACGILVPWPGTEPKTPALHSKFLTTGPSGMSPGPRFNPKDSTSTFPGTPSSLLPASLPMHFFFLFWHQSIPSKYYSKISVFGFACIRWWLTLISLCLEALNFISCQPPLGFPGDSVVRNLPVMQEMWVQSLGLENPLEEEMATHIQYYPVDRGAWWATVHGNAVGHDWATELTCMSPSFIPISCYFLSNSLWLLGAPCLPGRSEKAPGPCFKRHIRKFWTCFETSTNSVGLWRFIHRIPHFSLGILTSFRNVKGARFSLSRY